MTKNFNDIKIYKITYKIIRQNNNKKTKLIMDYCDKNDFSIEVKNIAVSILLIEQYFRPIHKRLLEYFLLTINIVASLLFEMKLHNYTIGKSQVGITYILRYYGFDRDIHSKYLYSLSLRETITILFSFSSYDEVAILLKRVSIYYKHLNANNYDHVLRKIGEMYNGKYSYGLLLESVYSCLED
jgi:hypothetical protein